MDLAEAVVQDVARLIHRVVIPDIDAWKKEQAKPAEPIVELPVYRRENGLRAHQKSFIKLAFDAHKNGGARYLLPDQAGTAQRTNSANRAVATRSPDLQHALQGLRGRPRPSAPLRTPG
jgi:hypothetical protein